MKNNLDHSPSTNINNIILNGSIWQGISLVTQAVLQLIVLAVLARNLQPADFGILALANIFLGLVGLFSQAGIGPAIVQRSDLSDSHISAGFLMTFGLGVFITSLTWYMSASVGVYFNNGDVVPVIRVLGFIFFITSFGIISESLLQREFEFKKLLVVNISSYLFGYATVGIILALLGFGVYSLVMAMLVQSLIRSIILILMRPYYIFSRFNKAHAFQLTKFGAGLSLARSFNYAALQADRFIIGKFLGVATLGFYQMAFNIMALLSRYVGDIIDKVLFTGMAHIQNDHAQLTKVYFNAYSIANLIILPVAAIMIINCHDIVSIILGDDWLVIVLPLQVLLAAAGFRISTRLSDSLLRAKGAVYSNAFVKLLFAIFVVSGSYFRLDAGLPGVAAGVFLAVFLHYLILSKLCLKYLDGSWKDYFIESRPGIIYAGIVLIVSGSVHFLISDFSLHPFISLALSMLSSILVAIAVLYKYPVTLGAGGLWLLNKAKNKWGEKYP